MLYPRLRWIACAVRVSILNLCDSTPVCGESDPVISFPMLSDPLINPGQELNRYAPRFKEVWLQALERPESTMKRQAADAIALGHQFNLKDLESSADRLAALVRDDQEPPIVRRSAAHALVVLDARQAADDLWEYAKTGGLDAQQIIEPALGRWQHAGHRQSCLKRLNEPSLGEALRLRAIHGVAAHQDNRAAERLQQLMEDEYQRLDIRLESAKALAKVGAENAVALAQAQLSAAGKRPLISRLLAVHLLQQASDPEAVTILQSLATNENSAVARLAFERLFQLDPQLAHEHVDWATAHADPALRMAGAKAAQTQGGGIAVAKLGKLLDDLHPDVRRYARVSLLEFASDDELKADVIEQANENLATESWRGLEQAFIIIAELDHKPAAERAMELLTHDRSEVKIASAWCLTRLRLPETLPALLKHVEIVAANNRYDHGRQFQMAHIFQFFGIMKYKPADELMRLCVPKEAAFDARLGLANAEPRAAAIWALGHTYADDPPPDLVRSFIQRFSDVDSEVPEAEIVRRFSAVSLGRMKASSAVEDLEKNEAPEELAGLAASWALTEITGRPLLPPPVWLKNRHGWFIEPFAKPKESGQGPPTGPLMPEHLIRPSAR